MIYLRILPAIKVGWTVVNEIDIHDLFNLGILPKRPQLTAISFGVQRLLSDFLLRNTMLAREKGGCLASVFARCSYEKVIRSVIVCRFIQTSFKHLPRQRRMNAVEREAVEGMLRMRPNKKILQAELVKDTGKYVILKDIHNIQTKISPKSDADSLLAEMRKVPGKNNILSSIPIWLVVCLCLLGIIITEALLLWPTYYYYIDQVCLKLLTQF